MRKKYITYYIISSILILILAIFISLKTNKIKRNIADYISEEANTNRDSINVKHSYQRKFNQILIIDKFVKIKKDSFNIKLLLLNEYIANSPYFKLYLNDKKISYDDLKKIQENKPKLKAIIFNPVTKETMEYEYK